MEIYEPLRAIMFDTIAAAIVVEAEADAHRRAGRGGAKLPPDMKAKAEERFKAQELISKPIRK